MIKAQLVLAFCVGSFSVVHAQTYTPGQTVDRDFDHFARTFLDTHCIDCHSEADPEGALSLHDLGPIDEVNAAIWKSVWAQVALGEMPPEDASEVEVAERVQFSDWIVHQLSREMKDKGGFKAHRDPNKGNYVDHDLLFGPLPDGAKQAADIDLVMVLIGLCLPRRPSITSAIMIGIPISTMQNRYTRTNVPPPFSPAI